MSKEERFEIFNEDGKWVIKDNEQMPHLLDLYKSCVRLNEFVDKIADLEAKLAESEKENAELHTAINMSIPNQIAMRDEIERLHTCVDDRIAELVEENEQLKQQLAEKEKEIEQLKKFDELNKTFFDLFRTAFKEPNKVDDLFNTLKTMQEKQDQDKISFCIEQLEKVKTQCEFSITFASDEQEQRLYAFIDQQIKELKEKK